MEDSLKERTKALNEGIKIVANTELEWGIKFVNSKENLKLIDTLNLLISENVNNPNVLAATVYRFVAIGLDCSLSAASEIKLKEYK